MQENHKIKTTQDTLVYFVIKIIEGILGIITLSAYKGFFDDTSNGIYVTLNKTLTITGTLLVAIFMHSAIRYVNSFEIENQHKKFYSSIIFSWLAVVCGFAVIFGVLYFSVYSNTPALFDKYHPRWIILAITAIFSYGSVQLFMGILGAKRKINLYLSLSLMSAVFKLAIPYFLTSRFGARIEWVLGSFIISDFMICVISVFSLKLAKYVSIKSISKDTIKSFLGYGVPLIGNTLSSIAINGFDIYIILYFWKETAQTTYYYNYGIASAAFTMIITAVAKGSYPNILKVWSQNKKDETVELISQTVRLYLIVMVPAFVGISCIANRITMIMYSTDEGYPVIIWISLGLVMLGLTEYSNKYWELHAKTKVMSRNAMLCALLNIIMNLILVPYYGYMASAFSLFLTYFIYFIISKTESRKYMKWSIKPSSYIKILASAGFMGISIGVASNILGGYDKKSTMILLIGLGVVVYFASLTISGEMKKEIQYIKHKLIKIN